MLWRSLVSLSSHMFEELEYFVTVNVIEFLQMNDCVGVGLVVELQYIAVD